MDFKKKSIGWLFTINNYDHYDLAECFELFDTTAAKYMILSFEEGDEGTPHIQGYIQFPTQRYCKPLSLIAIRAFFIAAKGSPKDNQAYCSEIKGKMKQLHNVEFGESPSQGQTPWDRIEDAMKNPKEHPQTYNQYRKAYVDIMAKEPPKIKERKIYKFPYTDRMQLLKHFFEQKKTFAIEESYSDEQVLFTDQTDMGTVPDFYQYWEAGYPQKRKYGYQHMAFDPDIIICLINYDDDKFLNKKLKSLPEYSIVNASQSVSKETDLSSYETKADDGSESGNDS